MALSGQRDPEGEKRRLEKLKELGTTQPGKVGRPRKDSTEVIEEQAAKRMSRLADKAIDAIERGLDSGSEKTALTAAAQFMKTFHHPAQKLDVSGTIEKTEQHIHMLKSQNQLSEADQNLLGDFLDVLRDASERDVIEAEVVEEIPQQLPPPSED